MANYVMGDTHGDQILWHSYIHPLLKKGDRAFIMGDFGVGFWNGRYWSEETFLDFLEEQPYTVYFVDGNHEDFSKLYGYPVVERHGGKMHQLRENLFHLMRGEIYTFDGKTVLAMGGGYSLDKATRAEGYDWWREEMPTGEEYRHCSDTLAKHHHQVDYIFTHTCPYDTLQYMATMNLGIQKNVTEEQPLTLFLNYLAENTTYDKWYFGHFHCDRELWRNQYVLLDAIRDMETGGVVRYRL
jgi:hypothetical protein